VLATLASGIQIIAVDIDGDRDIDLVAPGKPGCTCSSKWIFHDRRPISSRRIFTQQHRLLTRAAGSTPKCDQMPVYL
jgi:hypothetical protein